MKRGTTALSLDMPLGQLSGVGPKRAAALARLGIHTILDLIEYFPFRHERHFRTTIEMLEPGTIATVVGRVTGFRGRRHARGPAAQAAVQDNTGRCSVTWFNAPHVLAQLGKGAVVELTGKVGEFGNLPQFVNPKFRLLDDAADPIATPPAPRRGEDPGTLEPVYPGSAEINSQTIAKLLGVVLTGALPLVPELYPADYRQARGLPPRSTAIERMHRPTTPEDVVVARRRLAYDELMVLQYAVQTARRNRLETARARPVICTPQIDARIRRRFAFALTESQDRVIAEIVADLGRDRPMNRLLQGDVGSGKTAVAVYAALAAIANRRQVAVLAPTELLAQQHYRTIRQLLDGSRVRHALWTGGGTQAARAALRADAKSGALDLAVGTQAMLEKDVEFQRLGLVIVDEQHRLGVRQRTAIRRKGESPHYLVMTATPIPRTLAMTVFGDLDVSTIDRVLPGRAPVRTKIIGPSQYGHAWEFVRSRLRHGEQAYLVYPLVEESEGLPLRSAKREVGRVAEEILPGFNAALLHGQMSAQDKDAVMREFAEGRVQVLVATTVIEVGIDVPNATVMVIQHADRYGLAQLHQLRGRVGRGDKAGYCYLMVDGEAGGSDGAARETAAPSGSRPPTKDAATEERYANRAFAGRRDAEAAFPLPHGRGSESRTPSAGRCTEEGAATGRLGILTRTTDGFAIADEDLRQRGPGELLGTRQLGLPALRVADLLRDFELLRMAQRDAAEIIRGDPAGSEGAWRELRRASFEKYGAMMRFLEGA